MAKDRNKNKGFRLDDMPKEVYWAKFIGITFIGGECVQQVGIDQHNKIREIQKKYPEWFPWETKYDSIPQEVHEAYKREAYPYLYEAIDVGAFDKKNDWPTEAYVCDPDSFTFESMMKSISDMHKRQNEEDRKRKQQKAKDRKLWNKHYSKYGLEYRG